jgi:hypothetical protein
MGMLWRYKSYGIGIHIGFGVQTYLMDLYSMALHGMDWTSAFGKVFVRTALACRLSWVHTHFIRRQDISNFL